MPVDKSRSEVGSKSPKTQHMIGRSFVEVFEVVNQQLQEYEQKLFAPAGMPLFSFDLPRYLYEESDDVVSLLLDANDLLMCYPAPQLLDEMSIRGVFGCHGRKRGCSRKNKSMTIAIDGTVKNKESGDTHDDVDGAMVGQVVTGVIKGPIECLAVSVEWVYRQRHVKANLAISDQDSRFAHIVDARVGSNEPILSKEIHKGQIKNMRYKHVIDVVVSADVKGIIEYWSLATREFLEKEVRIENREPQLFAQMLENLL